MRVTMSCDEAVVDRVRRVLSRRRDVVEKRMVQERGSATEVIVTHARIASTALRDQHRHGWDGCLAGLSRYSP
jgi:hypothetical protein